MKGCGADRDRPDDALAEVTEATRQTLAGGRHLDRAGLHDGLRERVRSELLPWCKGCQSNHVSPMLWRYAGVAAGMRMDSERRFRSGRSRPGCARAPTSPAPTCASTGRRRQEALPRGRAWRPRRGGGCGTRSPTSSRRSSGRAVAAGSPPGPQRAGLAAAGLGDASDPGARPVPPAGRPRDAGPRRRGPQAVVPRGGESRSRPARRRSGGDVEGAGRAGRRPGVRGRSVWHHWTATSCSANAPASRRCAARARTSSPSRSPSKTPIRHWRTHTVVN